MLYILVNNNYHIDDLKKTGFFDLPGDKVLITIPHTLKVGPQITGLFSQWHSFNTPFKGFKSLLNYFQIKSVFKKIENNIQPTPEDTLVFFTDFEILNQYVIQLFKRVRGRVVMLEDAMATVPVGNMLSVPLSFRERTERWLLRHVYDLVELDLLAVAYSTAIPVIADRNIDVLGLNIRVPLKRNIPTYQLEIKDQHIDDLKKEVAIFINQDIYYIFANLSFDAYLKYLDNAITVMSTSFEKVYFKFHPRETGKEKATIEELLAKYPVVEIVRDYKEPIERQVEHLKPAYAVSFYSAGLRNLYFNGIEPCFIYNLVPEIRDSETGRKLTQYLDCISYRFITSFDELKVGYQSGIQVDQDGISLIELLIAK